MNDTVRGLDGHELALLTKVRDELAEAPRLRPMTAAAFAAYLVANPSTQPGLNGGPPHMGVLRAARAELVSTGFLTGATACDLHRFFEAAPPLESWDVGADA